MSDVEAAVKTTPAAQWDRSAPGQSSRLLSVDFMRGRVMVIMVLGLICTAAFIVLRASMPMATRLLASPGTHPGRGIRKARWLWASSAFWIWKSIRHHYNSC
jgi:hypothetical protein